MVTPAPHSQRGNRRVSDNLQCLLRCAGPRGRSLGQQPRRPSPPGPPEAPRKSWPTSLDFNPVTVGAQTEEPASLTSGPFLATVEGLAPDARGPAQ